MLIGEMIPTVDPVECAQIFITDESVSSNEMVINSQHKLVMISVTQCVLAKMYLWAAYEQICNTTTDMNLLVAITKLETLFEKVNNILFQIVINTPAYINRWRALLMTQTRNC